MEEAADKPYLEAEAYEGFVETVARYPHSGEQNVGALTYCILGLNGEAGELAEKLKKIYRDDAGTPTTELAQETREEMLKELGDVLWYVTRTAKELGYSLADVALWNVRKLTSRKLRGVIGGSGDNR